MAHSFGSWWNADGGPRQVLRVAAPLVLGTCSWTIQVFIDRLFLAWYSQDAIAAAFPAICVAWVVVGPLHGIVSFGTTFVAQYHGAGRPHRIGVVFAQVVLVSVVSGFGALLLWPAAAPFFAWIGHEAPVRRLEVQYFQILLVDALPTLLTAAGTCFFGGLGRTWLVLWANMAAAVVNVVLDYAMIFGHCGFPRMGIAGAGWATVVSHLVSAGILLGGVWLADAGGTFRVRAVTSWLPERAFLARLLRFGVPSGAMALVDVLAWTWFNLLVGKIGTAALATTNVAWNINTTAFLPMLGLSMATSILVGQRLGEDRPDLARRSTWSAIALAACYMGPMAVGYFAVPELFLLPFRSGVDPDTYAEWHRVIVLLLRFVAVYTMFDMAALIYGGALRGAGDTRFVMGMIVLLSVLVMAMPSYIAWRYFGGGALTVWTIATAYVVVLGIAFFLRFQWGPWETMRVIEPQLVEPEAPAAEPPALGGVFALDPPATAGQSGYAPEPGCLE